MGAGLSAAPAPHWSDAWLGRPWVAGEFECVDLVVAVHAQLGLGRPIPAAWLDAARRAGPARRAALLGAACRDWNGARALAPGEAVGEGDAAVLRYQGGQRPVHVGVMCAPTGGAPRHVLHCDERLGTVRQTVAALAARRMEVHGIWRWRR